jgi:hypothetical protein
MPKKPKLTFQNAEVLPSKRRHEANTDLMLYIPLEEVPDVIAKLARQLDGAVNQKGRKTPAAVRFYEVKLRQL